MSFDYGDGSPDWKVVIGGEMGIVITLPNANPPNSFQRFMLKHCMDIVWSRVD